MKAVNLISPPPIASRPRYTDVKKAMLNKIPALRTMPKNELEIVNECKPAKKS